MTIAGCQSRGLARTARTGGREQLRCAGDDQTRPAVATVAESSRPACLHGFGRSERVWLHAIFGAAGRRGFRRGRGSGSAHNDKG